MGPLAVNLLKTNRLRLKGSKMKGPPPHCFSSQQLFFQAFKFITSLKMSVQLYIQQFQLVHFKSLKLEYCEEVNRKTLGPPLH